MMRPGKAGSVRPLKEENMAKKSACPVTRSQFRAKAKPVTIIIGDVPMVVPTKEFSTGSLGWYLNGKTVLDIDGTPVTVQLGLNLTVIGSKELPHEPGEPAPKVDPAAPAAAPEPEAAGPVQEVA
jgi:hypothetical protein